MAYNRPTLQELITRTKSDFEGRLGTQGSALRRAFITVCARVWAGVIHLLYGYIAWVFRQIFPDTSDSENLRRHASFYNVFPKEATFAQFAVIFTGVDGTIIPATTQVQRSDGRLYTTDAQGTIAGGTVTVNVTAVDAGFEGNSELATELVLTTPIPGVDGQAESSTVITEASDEETDEDLLIRLNQRLANPPLGGSKADYERWALEVAGVTRAWVTPLVMGPGTVGVSFVVDNDPGSIFPDAPKIAEVQDYIETVQPVTFDLYVYAPTDYPVAMTIELTPDTAPIRAAVQAELVDLFKREAEPGGTILLSHVQEAISIATGETDHILTVPAANVTAPAGALPRLGAITWI